MIKIFKKLFGLNKGKMIFKYRGDSICFEEQICKDDDAWYLSCELNQHKAQDLFAWLEKKLSESKYTCDVCYEFKMPNDYYGQIKCSICSTLIIRPENQDSQ